MLPSFDELMKLAQQDPNKLEIMRQEWIEETISQAPENFQRRLKGLQFQIDMERERANNPVSSCVRISQMMHEGLANLRDVLNKPESPQPAVIVPVNADIIPFPLALAE